MDKINILNRPAYKIVWFLLFSTVHFQSYGPYNFTSKDRALYPKTVHFWVDPVKLQWNMKPILWWNFIIWILFILCFFIFLNFNRDRFQFFLFNKMKKCSLFRRVFSRLHFRFLQGRSILKTLKIFESLKIWSFWNIWNVFWNINFCKK